MSESGAWALYQLRGRHTTEDGTKKRIRLISKSDPFFPSFLFPHLDCIDHILPLLFCKPAYRCLAFLRIMLVSSENTFSTDFDFMQCSKNLHSTSDQSKETLNFRFWHNAFFFCHHIVILIKDLTLQHSTILNYFYTTEVLLLTDLGYRAWQKVSCEAYLFFRKICDMVCGSQEDADRAVSIVCSSMADSEPEHCSCKELLASKGRVSVIRMPTHTQVIAALQVNYKSA